MRRRRMGMREGMASTGGAAPSSDASRTDGFKLGLGSFAACFAGARPRFATRVCKRLLSQATILAGLSRPRLEPRNRHMWIGRACVKTAERIHFSDRLFPNRSKRWQW